MTSHLNSLVFSLVYRFKHTGDLTDISNAISYQQNVVYLIPEGHASMSGRLNNLGNAFRNRFKHTEDLADISTSLMCALWFRVL